MSTKTKSLSDLIVLGIPSHQIDVLTVAVGVSGAATLGAIHEAKRGRSITSSILAATAVQNGVIAALFLMKKGMSVLGKDPDTGQGNHKS